MIYYYNIIVLRAPTVPIEERARLQLDSNACRFFGEDPV